MELEKTLESLLDSKEIKLVNPKGNQQWIFIGTTDTETEAPILWPLDEKSQLTGKDADAGKDWGQEEKGVVEDEMVGWHHRLNEHEFEQTPGDGEAGRAAVHRVCKELDMTEWQPVYVLPQFHAPSLGWTLVILCPSPLR